MKIGVVVHPDKPEAREAEGRLKQLAEAHGWSVEEASGEASFDLIVALGGDGTILRAAGLALRGDTPLLGVNLGRFGYLSSVVAPRMEEAIQAIAESRSVIDERMMLRAETTLSGGRAQMVALNEVVLSSDAPSRVIRVKVSVGEQEIATYTVDGFIVSTPTGSTAYSLSAGGPIVEPKMEALILTPVSPHWPLWRPVVVGADRVVTMELLEGTAALAADGSNLGKLEPGGRVVAQAHDRKLRLADLEGYGFFRRIRGRFHIDPTPELPEGQR